MGQLIQAKIFPFLILIVKNTFKLIKFQGEQ